MKKDITKSATKKRCYMNWGYFEVKCGMAAGPVKTMNIVQTTILLVMRSKGLSFEKGEMTLVFGVCTKKRSNMVLKLKNIIKTENRTNYLDCKWYFNFSFLHKRNVLYEKFGVFGFSRGFFPLLQDYPKF